RTIRVYDVGDVQEPGAHDISSLSTPLNALFVAGGPTAQGSMRNVKHYRGNQLVETVDLYDLLLHGVRTDMQRLENGDTIMVPPIGPQVTVEGMVRRPAIYELRDEKNLASVLELAGGLLPTAALRHIEVQRVVAHDKRTMLSLDIADSSDPSEVTKKLESFPIADGDRVRVFPIAAYNQDAVFLEGHVIRPGRYSYRSDMRVTDIISSYKDLLPEPATKYAEIIRLNAPDFRPSVESFDLATAFADPSKAPILHPLDTVRIFSKYDFENPPVVSVWGDVRMPGTYRTSGQIHLSDAVHLAGGLEPDAQTEDAQVFRYLPDGKMKIFSVSLSGALAGETAENIVLEPRDRLLIHKSSSSVEPASVFVEGAVARPGRYPLTTNMDIADLIRVGGGLKPSADTQLADLTHYEWNNRTQLTGQHQPVSIAAALAGDSASNVPVHNGDVLTIREVSGWNDLGAFVALKGEVRHPGTYGVRPGERLSSVIERAGGFQPDAYAYGAILQRTSVRELEAKSQDEMILRLKSQQSNIELLPVTTPQETRAKDMALQQYEATLEQLSTNPPVGRVAIRISPEIKRWQNSSSDIAVAAGDTVTIPKRPGFVMVMGQVYNPTAVAYRPGKSAKWYLSQSGGPSAMADKKAIFVIRADGSVVGARQSLWSGESLGSVLKPGDTVVVPEKAIAGGVQWQNIFLAAQVASSIASTVFIAVR
ncbi:MAG: SLBB domain-containing protein, partial [Blastocatellia bacterium]